MVAASWEVQGDDGWIPFRPGCKFKDEPGTIQHICHGKFWYALTFDEDGLTGTQSNTCTGKVRQLRRVLPTASPDERPAADITSTNDQSQEKKMQTQPALPAACPHYACSLPSGFQSKGLQLQCLEVLRTVHAHAAQNLHLACQGWGWWLVS